MRPDEALFWEHVDSAGFQAGADRGKWGLSNEKTATTWPLVFIWINSCRTDPNTRVTLRFDLEQYPSQAPAACPWDMDKNDALEPAKWPRGNPALDMVFNTEWRAKALYCPMDRVALHDGYHNGWKSDLHSEYYWSPSFTICNYLEFLYQILN